MNISIHALRGEGDGRTDQGGKPPNHFYPRPPRGGRPDADLADFILLDISIHALREEGDVCLAVLIQHGLISIHALREEGDFDEICKGKATQGISIHALREEGDKQTCAINSNIDAFLSTPSARRATHDRFHLWSA